MNNLDAILEVAIGLVLTWLIISVATVEVQNLINKWFYVRAKHLEKSILTMFQNEQSLVDQFYEQPVIQALYPRNRKGEFKKNIFGKIEKPGYIPNEDFAEALFEMFVKLGTEDDKFDESITSIERALQKFNAIDTKNKKDLSYFLRRLLPDIDGEKSVSSLRKTHSKITQFKGNAENWFDLNMQRASYWYGENVKNIAFLIGFVLAISFNVDSINITNQLWREPTLRQSLVAQAQVADINTGPDSVLELEEYYQELKLPIGWNKDKLPTAPLDWISKAIGFLITGLAAMQGAPFWFDMLKKILRLKDKESGSSAPPPQPPAPQPPSEPEPVG